jgi:hypothetical protein
MNQLSYKPENIWYNQEIKLENLEYIPEKTLERLKKILIEYREKADKKLSWKDFWYETKYPIWHCWEIRDSILELLKQNITFTNWLEFKKIYWSQNWQYFQNAIQIWDVILDVANDTVESNSEKIIISRISEKLIENISNYHDYCEIAEKYWWYKIIPNIYLDKVKYKYPFFFQRKDWVIYLPDFIDFINSKDEKNNFLLAKDFLENNKYKNNKLEKEYSDFLNNSDYINKQDTVPPINKEIYKLYLRIKKSKNN